MKMGERKPNSHLNEEKRKAELYSISSSRKRNGRRRDPSLFEGTLRSQVRGKSERLECFPERTLRTLGGKKGKGVDCVVRKDINEKNVLQRAGGERVSLLGEVSMGSHHKLVKIEFT